MDGEATEPGVLTWADFLARGKDAHDAEVDRRTAAAKADDVATLIYTSGTTGTPKGVMLTQRNLSFIAVKAQEILPVGAGDRLISYLPLSHIAEQVVSHLLSLATGACVHFAESLEKLPENLREVRPHLFLGVPRVWEKIQAGMQAAGAQASPLRVAGSRPGRRGSASPEATPTRKAGRGPGTTASRITSSSRRSARGWASTTSACLSCPPRPSPRRRSTTSRAWPCRSWRSTA